MECPECGKSLCICAELILAQIDQDYEKMCKEVDEEYRKVCKEVDAEYYKMCRDLGIESTI